MKKMFTRLAALALAVSVCLSCFTVSASASTGSYSDSGSLSEWNTILSAFDVGFDVLDFFTTPNILVGQVSPDRLLSYCNSLNGLCNANGAYDGGVFVNTRLRHQLTDQGRWDAFLDALDLKAPHFDIAQDGMCNNVWRIVERTSNRWLVDKDGLFPYCSNDDYKAWATGEAISTTPSTTVTDNPSNSYRRQWVESEDAVFSSFVRVTQDALATAIVDLGRGALAKIKLGGDWFYVICDSVNDAYLCNRSNQVYAAPVEPEKSAVENPVINNYTDGTVVIEDGDNIQEQNVNVEVSPNFDYQTLVEIQNALFHPLVVDGETVVIGDGTQFIDSLTYNTDNRSYTLNTYDYTFNITNNYYEYNFYTYNIQYTYNNTYVTYIGSTAEYQPTEYALYYQLPDGRSSADLTEEDIAGLSFQFADCVNYNRGVTDESLLALYHFDGNTDDDSYYNTADSFTWNTGASITYMESNAFDGCLYLDEKEHEFTLTLPQDLAYSNFTLSFRYYQNSATTSTNNDNYITAGSNKLLSWSEQYLYGLGTTQLSTGLSVGTWQELALIRVGETLYFYHNGVKVSSASFSSMLGHTLTFHFGGSSKAYAMLDELRVLSFAWVSDGGNYTVSTVPFDTNEVLVLPETRIDIEDEGDILIDTYMDYVYTYTPVWKFDAENFSYSPLRQTTKYSYTDSDDKTTNYDYYSCFLGSNTDYIHRWQTFTGVVNPSVANGLVYFPSASANLQVLGDSIVFKNNASTAAPAMILGFAYRKNTTSNFSYYGDMQTCPNYTITIVYDDYTIESKTISYASTDVTSVSSKSITFSHDSKSLTVMLQNLWFALSNVTSQAQAYHFVSVYGNLGVRYIEMVQGSTPNPHQYVYDYYEWDEVIPGEEYVPGQDYYENLIQPNTAAIQTDIPINGYTVGGVRPTFPVRGDVWFPVEGSRISGVQVYNGRAWEEVNARWWTGSRWIPIYAFDLITLEDMWDVGSYDGGDVEASITSEYGFWNWWKNSWTSFTNRLFAVFDSGGGSSGSVPDDVFEEVPGEEEGESWSFFDLLVALKDGTWEVIKGSVTVVFGGVTGIVSTVGSIGGFFSSVGDLFG